MRHHHQDNQEILATMDTHKNPNLEETTNNLHLLPSPSSCSSRDFRRTHLQNMNRVPKKINEDEGLAVKKPSLSCSSLQAAGKQEEIMTPPPPPPSPGKMVVEESGRERLKRHRADMAGRVWIPDIWGHEDLLKDWIDCTVFDSSLGNNTIMSARAALVQEGRSTLRIENRC
ncbi:protein BIC1-like [Cynara cardunculus var. scolymus]|uniref:protein BIC1-like n=1 Tax=Cynara cardunculus var. scolymus TaxID=59895 RepID=UPI000D625BB6|nr:protein BIC1-like [Cynara cardunculus var. scolymus]